VRLWLTFAFHLPFFSRLNYLKYVMGFENAALATTACAFVAQLTSFVALPLTMRFVKKSGKMSTMVAITTLASITNAAFALIPPLEFRRLSLYALQPVVEGFTQTALYTIPEMILADVIDYDELVYGERREGIFVVFDVNITQLMDILAAVLPGLILSALGYHGNGGCACGCGVKCPSS
jgi:GPH family glycoside/pentoside/hexuronide:cation symporter